MNRDPVIQAKDLTKRYEDLVAVDHISFQVQVGEIFGLLGPNGSGKSTTIRMLVGLSRPTEGCAMILGRDILSSIIEVKKHVGVVPDISNLYDELSAKENLLFMAKLYGVPKMLREQRADDLLKAFGLYERKDSKFGTFSRGMKRALTIAAALMHEPRILFLDEPTVGLDVVAARSLRNLISNLRGQGLTIILTTHYLEEVDQLCDRIAILVKGRIVNIDSPEGLKSLAKGQPTIEVTFSEGILELKDDLSRRLSDSELDLLDNNKVRIYGDDPRRVFQEVFQFSVDHKLGLEAVNSITPSLEDAFVRITGLSPTIMLKEKGGK
jgi:ABC-2 type transport system ATP-binding protein